VLWQPQGVEIAGVLTAEDHRACGQVLNRKANRIKFNRDVIVTG
jgi:hypothetical protein